MSEVEDQSASATVVDIDTHPLASLDPLRLKNVMNVVKNASMAALNDLGGVQGVMASLATDSVNGIPGDANDIKNRTKYCGANFSDYPKPDLVNDFRLCTQEAIRDPLIIILLVFTLVSLCFGIKHHGIISVWPERGTELLEIVAVVIVSAVANFWPVTQSHRDLSAKAYVDYNPRVDVVRGGVQMKISTFRVVVGDIVFLQPGDQVPGEGLFIDGNSLHLENVIFGNGETGDHAKVGSGKPFIFSGNMVAEGYSKMVVTAVANSRKIQQQPPLAEVTWVQGMHSNELKNLTSKMARIGNVFALLTFTCFLFRYCAKEQNEVETGKDVKEGDFVKFLFALVGIMTDSAIIALTSSLEGLFLAVKSTLAYSTRSLWRYQVLIKQPSLSHQVASVDTICLSSGALSTDTLEVKKFYIGLSSIEEVPPNLIAPTVLDLLHQAIGINTNQPCSGSTSSYPSSTERAISEWATLRLGMNKKNLVKSCTILETEPFNPASRKSGVLISADKVVHVHRKGAADVILSLCSHYYETTGVRSVIDITTRGLLDKLVQGMEDGGLRCIASAHRTTSVQEYFNFSSQNLTLLGLVGLKNPQRPAVKTTVEHLHRAGIKFKLLTGDSTPTATFMALRSGLLYPDYKPGEVVEGEDFRNWSPEERIEKVHQIRVLARAIPSDKLLMVEGLKQNGRVVAYLGGGHGDVHAVKHANVGICFGTEGGAEILKACSDIVIKKKDFPVVIEILKWGRGFL